MQIAQSHVFVNCSPPGNDEDDFVLNPSRDVHDDEGNSPSAPLVDCTKESPQRLMHKYKSPPTLMLIYPFKGDTQRMEDAAMGTWGLGGASEVKESTTEIRERGHFVRISDEDYHRLDSGKWLNDELVDLWMLWYVSYSKIIIVSHFLSDSPFVLGYLVTVTPNFTCYLPTSTLQSSVENKTSLLVRR